MFPDPINAIPNSRGPIPPTPNLERHPSRRAHQYHNHSHTPAARCKKEIPHKSPPPSYRFFNPQTPAKHGGEWESGKGGKAKPWFVHVTSLPVLHGRFFAALFPSKHNLPNKDAPAKMYNHESRKMRKVVVKLTHTAHSAGPNSHIPRNAAGPVAADADSSSLPAAGAARTS